MNSKNSKEPVKVYKTIRDSLFIYLITSYSDGEKPTFRFTIISNEHISDWLLLNLKVSIISDIFISGRISMKTVLAPIINRISYCPRFGCYCFTPCLWWCCIQIINLFENLLIWEHYVCFEPKSAINIENPDIWFDSIDLVFNATFSNISAISWRPVLVVEEAGVPGENRRPWASNW